VAKWNVGDLDGRGRQPVACLSVRHHKGAGYVATLSVMWTEDNDRARVEHYKLLDPAVKIDEQAAARFSRPSLNKLYEKALAEVRRRFKEGDADVVSHFDAASAAYTA
jgi:hypothetical protein